MGRELEERISAAAARQHGVVSRSQLVELGLTSAAVWRRLQAGRLRALHRGVYLLGPTQTHRTTEIAAVLAGGAEALLSHLSAARVWPMLPPEPPAPVHVSVAGPAAPVHVSVPGRSREPRCGVIFHRTATLRQDERTVVDGIPITTPVRTLVDIAGMLGSRDLESAIALAERENLIRAAELNALPERYAHRPGIGMLRAIVQAQAGPAFTRSEAERQCLDLFRRAGLSLPHANVPFGPYELDLFWPDEMVAIEIDGHAYHASRRQFEGDRRKDAWLRARGVEVIRLTWRQITRDGLTTAVQVGQALAIARSRRGTVPHDTRQPSE